MMLKSTIAAVALTVPLGVAFAGPASASVTPDPRADVTAKSGTWSPWANLHIRKPVHMTACGGHQVEYRDYIQREKYRTRKIATQYGPATEVEAYGRYVGKLIDHTAKTSALINASGSSLGRNSQIVYKDGTYLFRATGANILFNNRVQSQASGLPHLAVLQGRVGVLYGKHSGGDSAQVITRPDSVTDACTLLQ